MRIQQLKLEDITPYPGNPRQNADAVDAVANSIRQFGFRQPIVVDSERVIICGHTRFLAAQKLGLAKVPVHVASELTADQVRALRLADNKTHDLSTWDLEKLLIEVSALQDAADLNLADFWFSADQVADLLGDVDQQGLTDPDEIPSPPSKAVTKLGDIWILGDHRVMCGDSARREDLDQLLAGETVHLVNTDPPYNVKVEPRSNNAIAAARSKGMMTHHQGGDLARHPGKKKATGKQLRAKDRPLANDFMSDAEFDKLLDAWFGNISRVLVPGRGFYIWGGYANCANYPPVLKKHALYFSQAVIWVKEHPVLTRKDFMGNHEWAFYGWREGAGHQFFGEPNIRDVWELSRDQGGDVRLGPGLQLQAGDGARLEIRPPSDDPRLRTVAMTGETVRISSLDNGTDVWSVKKVSPQSMVHLTEKPVELAARAMRYSSRPGEHVLDLFGGSGSTLIGAEVTGRKAFLMELDPLYCDVIIERFEKFTGRKAVKHGGETRAKPRRAVAR